MRTVSEQASAYEGRSNYTYEDYLALPDDGYRYELLNGSLVCEPAPTRHHQRVVGRLFLLLTEYFAAADPLGEVFTAPLDVRLAQSTVVQPDLVYFSSGRYKSASSGEDDLPELVVEVLSPSTRVRDRLQKTELFRQAKIPHYWLVELETGTVEALRLQAEHYSICANGYGQGLFAHPEFPGLSLDLAVLFSKPN